MTTLNPSSFYVPTNHNGIVPLSYNSPDVVGCSMDSLSSHLTSLACERSSYASVSCACAVVNAFASYGDSSSSSPCLSNSQLYHPPSFVRTISSLLVALSSCAENHLDRRCRALAVSSLSLVSLGTYARLRTCPYLHAVRDLHQEEIEDDIINWAIIPLLKIIVEEDDDGISCLAAESLFRLVHIPDELSRAMEGLWCRPSPYSNARTLLHPWADKNWNDTEAIAMNGTALEDTWFAASMMELRHRILGGMVPSRIRRIVHRVSLYKRGYHIVRALSFLTETIIYLCRTEFARRETNECGRMSEIGNGNNEYTKDIPLHDSRLAFAKRWHEFDAYVLRDEIIKTIIMPLLQGGYESDAMDNGVATSLCALRLCITSTLHDGGMDVLSKLVLSHMTMKLDAGNSNNGRIATRGEGGSSLVVATLIAARGVSLPERLEALKIVALTLSKLPSIEFASGNVICAGLSFHDHKDDTNSMMFVRPVRMGMWVELALSLLIPDVSLSTYSIGMDSNFSTNSISSLQRSEILKKFLDSPIVLKILSRKITNDNNICHQDSDSNEKNISVIDPAEEVILALCSVSSLIIEWISLHNFFSKISETKPNRNNTLVNKEIQETGQKKDNFIMHEIQIWLKCALTILHACSSCLRWKHRSVLNIEEQCTCPVAVVQSSYIRLLAYVLKSMNYLHPLQSVYDNFLSDNRAKESSGKPFLIIPYLASYIDNSLENDIVSVTDGILETILIDRSEQISSRGIRFSILALLCDAWTRRCLFLVEKHRSVYKHTESSDVVLNMREGHARELLALLATELSSLLDFEREHREKSINAESMVTVFYLYIGTSCIESIARSAHQWSKGFEDRDNEGEYLVSMCRVVLEGQGYTSRNGNDCPNVAHANSKNIESCPNQSQISMMSSLCSEAASRIRTYIDDSDTEIATYIKSSLDDKSKSNDNNGLSAFELFCQSNTSLMKAISSDDFFSIDRTRFLWNLTQGLIMISFYNRKQCGNSVFTRKSNIQNPCCQDSLIKWNKIFNGETFEYGYIMQLYRQIILHNTKFALLSSPLASYTKDFITETSSSIFSQTSLLPPKNTMSFVTARPLNPYRLDVPPIPIPHPSSAFGSKAHWSNSIITVTSGSDPISLLMAYSIRQCPRYDGELERRVVVTMQLYNVTPVPIRSGLRLDLKVLSCEVDGDNRFSMVTSSYPHVVLAGDYLTWEVVLDPFPAPTGYTLHVSVTFCNMEVESSSHRWVIIPGVTDNTDDEGKDKSDPGPSLECNELLLDHLSLDDGCDHMMDVIFSGLHSRVSPFLTFHPCPLVFFCGKKGDEASFRFLWFGMPHQWSRLHLIRITSEVVAPTFGDAGRILADSSALYISSDCGIQCFKAWAFATGGTRLLCLLTCSQVIGRNIEEQNLSLLVRSDNSLLLHSMLACDSTRKKFVSDLLAGRWLCNDSIDASGKDGE